MAAGFMARGVPVLSRADLAWLATFPVYPLDHPDPDPEPDPAVTAAAPDEPSTDALARWGEAAVRFLAAPAQRGCWHSFGAISFSVHPEPGTWAERRAVLVALAAAGRIESRVTPSRLAASGQVQSYRIADTTGDIDA